MYLKLSKIFLLEAKIDDIISSNKDIAEYFEPFRDTVKPKYLNWIVKNYKKHFENAKSQISSEEPKGSDTTPDFFKEVGVYNDIIDHLNKFDLYSERNLIKNKDITNYSVQDLHKVVKTAEKEFQKQEEIKQEENKVNKVYSDSNWLIVEPLSKSASCKYGKNTKWCISATGIDTEGNPDENWFNQYSSQGAKFLFIINRKTNNKFAIAYSPELKEVVEYFDEKDNSLNLNQIKKLVPENILKIALNYADIPEQEILYTNDKDIILYKLLIDDKLYIQFNIDDQPKLYTIEKESNDDYITYPTKYYGSNPINLQNFYLKYFFDNTTLANKINQYFNDSVIKFADVDNIINNFNSFSVDDNYDSFAAIISVLVDSSNNNPNSNIPRMLSIPLFKINDEIKSFIEDLKQNYESDLLKTENKYKSITRKTFNVLKNIRRYYMRLTNDYECEIYPHLIESTHIGLINEIKENFISLVQIIDDGLHEERSVMTLKQINTVWASTINRIENYKNFVREKHNLTECNNFKRTINSILNIL